MFISYGQGPETLLRHYGFLCSCGSCSPIEHQEPKREHWELEYWQKRASCEEVKDQFREWGTESAEGGKSADGTENIVDGWGVESTREINLKKETNVTFGEW
jgi:hypothetical protein